MTKIIRFLPVLAFLAVTWVALASPASAASWCDTDAPVPAAPASGLAGAFMPDEPPPVTDPDSMWQTTGAGGFGAFTWDLGCNPAKQIAPGTDVRFSNMILGGSVAMTAATDAVQRWAFSPDWVTGLLGDFTDRMVDMFRTSVWAPIMAFGLVIVSLTLLMRSRDGNVRSVASGAGWAALVVVIAGAAFAMPLYLAVTAQDLSGAVISDLHGSETDPSTAQTDMVLESVHYNLWVRRTFGSADSPVVQEHARAIFDAVTYTYEEQKIAESSPLLAKALIEAHAESFREHATAVCDANPDACEYLHGRRGRLGLSAMEFGFSAAANLFRMVVALLVAMCVLLLVGYFIVWGLTAAYIIQPRGEAFGRSLLNKSGTAVAYTLLAAAGSWAFGLWSQLALAPGLSSWVSFAMLALGAVIFWGIIRPDRKLLSLATGGKVDGVGRMGKFVGRHAMTYFVSKHATEEALEEHADSVDDQRVAAATAPDSPAPAVAAPAPSPVVPDVPPVRPGLPSAEMYRRPDPTPEPPDPGMVILQPDSEGVYRREEAL